MITNVLEYLEKSANKNPNKEGFISEKESLTYIDMQNNAKKVATGLINGTAKEEAIAVFMEKSPSELTAFCACVYAGCFYVPIDVEIPEFRIKLILNTIKPRYVIVDDTTKEYIEKLEYKGKALEYRELLKTKIDEEKLKEIREKQIDTDPVYAVFTSGSTGTPKGIIANHKSIIDYIENVSEVLGFDENTIAANQAPFYGDSYLKDFGSTVKSTATMIITPKQHFMFPINLIKFLNENKVNSIAWTASALALVSAVKAFDKETPKYIKTVAFVGEVFPVKHLNIWKSALPNARYINMYGPTEATGLSCYYEVDRDFEITQTLPIGRPFKNTKIILLDENGNEVKKGEEGEICITGSCLTMGYYDNKEKTKESFVQNPLNTKYPEIIYKTGDLGKYNERGELLYISRKDFQIKHLGHRIELGEIEVVLGSHEKVKNVAAIFDEEKQKIALYYEGEIDKKEIAAYAKEKLPRYMFPSYIEQLEKMPYTTNGKIDRAGLKARYKEKK